MDTVFSIVRKIYDREPTVNMDDLDVNTTLHSAGHLGPVHAENLRFAKNHLWKSLKQLSKETEELIKNQTGINGVTMIDNKGHMEIDKLFV